jgi:hypothetical protein
MAAIDVHAREVELGPVPIQEACPTFLQRPRNAPFSVMVIYRLPTQANLREQCLYWQLVPFYASLELVQYRVHDLGQWHGWWETSFCFRNKCHDFYFYLIFIEYTAQRVVLELFMFRNTNIRNPFIQFEKSLNHLIVNFLKTKDLEKNILTYQSDKLGSLFYYLIASFLLLRGRLQNFKIHQFLYRIGKATET